jgi:hypothetical protein
MIFIQSGPRGFDMQQDSAHRVVEWTRVRWMGDRRHTISGRDASCTPGQVVGGNLGEDTAVEALVWCQAHSQPTHTRASQR